MAELVDALVSGTSIRKDVQVRVLFRAPNQSRRKSAFFIYLNRTRSLSANWRKSCSGHQIRADESLLFLFWGTGREACPDAYRREGLFRAQKKLQNIAAFFSSIKTNL